MSEEYLSPCFIEIKAKNDKNVYKNFYDMKI